MERIVALVDLEALGVIDASRVVAEIPTVPRRATLILRDVVIALGQMPAQDERPWHDFHDRFARTHTSQRRGRTRGNQRRGAAVTVVDRQVSSIACMAPPPPPPPPTGQAPPERRQSWT